MDRYEGSWVAEGWVAEGPALRVDGAHPYRVRGRSLVVFAALVLGCSDSGEVPLREAPPGSRAAADSGVRAPESGRWNRVPARESDEDDALQRDFAALDAIGYRDGSTPAPERAGVFRLDPERIAPGLNFYISGHAAEAFLMDAAGRVRHRWAIDYEAVWKQPATKRNRNTHYWRHAELLPNGDLLAIHEGMGLLRVDRDSNLKWAVQNRSHHDLFAADNGDIYVLTRQPHLVPRIHASRLILEDYIAILTPDGVEKRRVSVLEALERSEFANHLERAAPFGDLFHTNTIEIFDGSQAHRSAIFVKGNALISLRNLDLLAIIDLEAERAVWAQSGDWKQQHKPTLLDSGHILLFDNQGSGGRSRVLEIDPLSGEHVWSYGGSDVHSLYSETTGSCQRLHNGNTLIVESEKGRALEVTPEGELVWEFLSPHRAGDHGEWVATLFDVVRIGNAKDYSWLASD